MQSAPRREYDGGLQGGTPYVISQGSIPVGAVRYITNDHPQQQQQQQQQQFVQQPQYIRSQIIDNGSISSNIVGSSVPYNSDPTQPTKKEKETLRTLRKAEEDLDALKAALQGAQNRLKEREAERKVIKVLKAEKNKLQDRVTDLEDQLNTEAEEKNDLSRKVHDLEDQLQKLQARSRALEAQLREEVREKEQRHSAVEQLTREIDTLRTRDIESRRIVSQEEQRRIAQLIEENASLQRRLSEREQQLQDLANWATAAHQQLHDLSGSVSRESGEANLLREKLRELELQLVDEMQKKEGLRYHLDLQRSNESARHQQQQQLPYVPQQQQASTGRLSTYVMDEPRPYGGFMSSTSTTPPNPAYRSSSQHTSPQQQQPQNSYPRSDPRHFYARYDRGGVSSGASAGYGSSGSSYGGASGHGTAVRSVVA